jgi:peptidoglycan/LPS O-acetylase OafA/YrhL
MWGIMDELLPRWRDTDEAFERQQLGSKAANKVARFYSPQLDGLRFIAAMLVFLHHAPKLPYIATLQKFGWVGVDLFLAISAFLITKLVLIEHQRTGKFSVRSFFIRRALRIWPLYLGYASLACAVSALFHVVTTKEALLWWASHLTFTNNLRTAAEGFSRVSFSAHLWTISLEEQAYIAMAFLLAVFTSRQASKSSALWFCLTGTALALLIRVVMALNLTVEATIWTLPIRADAFLLGALAAILNLRGKPWISVVGIALVATVYFSPDGEPLGLYNAIDYSVIAAGLVILVVAAQTKAFLKPLGNPAARYLGKVSFGFYVFHGFTLWAASRLGMRLGCGPIIETTLAFVTTVVISALSYRLFETPFLVIKERFARVASRPI